jgi:hypothetical protein
MMALTVIPAKAGVQPLDSRVRANDNGGADA